MSPGAPTLPVLPIVLVPVGTDEAALDACLAALDAGTPAGTRVWLADDAQAGPRAAAIIEGWLARTPLQAAHTRRAGSIGEAAHIDQALRACGDGDVVVLASDARPAPGWLQQLAACLARDPAIATATPWCNAGEAAAWPRVGEITAIAHAPRALADACARLTALHPELPSAVGHAVLVRGSARMRAGGLDAASYRSWYAALIDLSLRLAGLGWRNALCETAFPAQRRRPRPGRRHGPAVGALARLARAHGRVPDGGHVAWPPRRARRSACAGRGCHPAARPVRRRGSSVVNADAIAAVVVSHRSAATLDDCLSRLRDADGVAEIRVVDNASDDGSLEIAQRHAMADPRLRFIANPDNPGFAVACNQGALDTAAPWLAFVNPDCLVEPASLARMRAHAAGFDAALVGADLVDDDGVRDAAARRRDPDFAAMLRDPSRARLGIDVDATQALQPVDAVSGALMLVPRRPVRRVGWFDDSLACRRNLDPVPARAGRPRRRVAVANDVAWCMCGACPRVRDRLFGEWPSTGGCGVWFASSRRRAAACPARLAVGAMIWLRFRWRHCGRCCANEAFARDRLDRGRP